MQGWRFDSDPFAYFSYYQSDPMPRPTKLTPAVQKNITDALMAGNYFDAACQYAGISERTGYNWMERGRNETVRRENPRVKEGTEQWDAEEIYVQFFQAVSHATAHVEVGTIAKIKRLGDDDWRALAWFMEHRYPDKWGKRAMSHEHSGKNGGAIEVQWSQVMRVDPDETDDPFA